MAYEHTQVYWSRVEHIVTELLCGRTQSQAYQGSSLPDTFKSELPAATKLAREIVDHINGLAQASGAAVEPMRNASGVLVD